MLWVVYLDNKSHSFSPVAIFSEAKAEREIGQESDSLPELHQAQLSAIFSELPNLLFLLRLL